MNVAYPSRIFTGKLAGLLLFAFLLVDLQGVNAQKISKACNISWMGVKKLAEPGYTEAGYLYFEGAQFAGEFPLLPLYSELVSLPGLSEAIGAQIINPVFVTLTDSEQVCINNNNLSSEIISNVSTEIERGQHFAKIEFYPFRKNLTTNKTEKLVSFVVSIDFVVNDEKYTQVKTNTTQSVLSSGNWYKLGVKSTGIHKLSYTDLVNMGIDPESINPKNIRVYGNGGGILPEPNSGFRYDDLVENPIYISGEEDSIFNQEDYLLFYGKAAVSWVWDESRQKFSHINNYYSDHSYYFLTTDLGEGKRIGTKPSLTTPATHIVDKFNDFACHEKDELNLTKSGKVWYGEKFEIKNTWDIPSFSFPNIDGDSPVYFETDLAARSTSTSTFKVYVNGGEAISALMPPISLVYNTDYAIPVNAVKNFFLNTPVVNVKLTYIPAVSNSIGWLNYVEFNVIRSLTLAGNQMAFRAVGSLGLGNISEFRINNTQSANKVWDVTDITNIQRQETVFESNSLYFRAASDSLREYVVFNGNSFLSVESVKKIGNQNLHALQPVDFIIVTHPSFLSQAEHLKAIHETEGLSALIVTPDQIYNEFSSGAQDITAIRDFIKMLYDRASAENKPKYVLLFGDASFDYKSRITNNTNYVPAFESANSLRPTESYVSDDYFGLMDINEGKDCFGTLDLGIGRLPVKTQAEANAAIDKIELYMGLKAPTGGSCNSYTSTIQRLGDWRNRICFVADDQDNNMHLSQAEDLATYVDTAFQKYNTEKIYFDAYTQLSTPGGQRYPEVTADINQKVTKGAIIVNYTGHGGETGWAHERVLEVSDINSWTNTKNMPVFVTATCEFSRYDDPERNSAGEYVFLNPVGGGIALFTTSRLSFSSTNFALNMNFYLSVFKKNNEEYPRMGEVMRKAKTPSNPNIRNFVLLGDPALKMAYPRYNIITESINGKPAGIGGDTLRAYTDVSISGFVSDDFGNKLTSFNGLLYPTVYDKPIEVTTIGNDPDSHPTVFTIQKNIIYKGKVSVVDGAFTFNFVVPKDIAYKYGNGRISYYAQNGVTDANGVFQDFIIGGSETTFNNDLAGPAIQIYMNDPSFQIGGLTDENPILISRVVDSSGINTTSNGIGHDIVAMLDDNTEKSVILNDYYEADLNSYQSGTVRYPFSNLSNGQHNLRVKVWDIYNNSAEAYTEFVVAQSGDLILESVLNFPNPFSDQTEFKFEHNHPCCSLDVEIKIYDVNGQLIKTIKETIATNGFNGGPVSWDGRSDSGARISRGVYFYKLRIIAEDGTSFEKSNKLMVLK